jgi:epoxyqueuosine reductase
MTPIPNNPDYALLAKNIKDWAAELGFQQVGITDINLAEDETRFQRWLNNGFQGNMEYMARHGTKRSRPQELVPGTLRVISVRMNYLASSDRTPETVLEDGSSGYISRYALGRDYHKLMRNRLQQLAKRMEQEIGEFGYRAFVDSAPVLEKALAENAGLGWTGKHSLLINKDAGSFFFLGELFTDLPLPVDEPVEDHCGTCTTCLEVCPTQAIIAPYEVDARRCISYLTIELKGPIPEELRPLMGNRIYGCDDCQLACPWNRFAKETREQDFLPRQGLEAPKLVELFSWTEEEFLGNLEGSPIRRIGHESWLRNIAVALGNAPTSEAVIVALKLRKNHESELVQEHVRWALEQHG